MKRKIITYSPKLYSFICFIINLILCCLVMFISFWIINKSLIWVSVLVGIFYIGLFWFIFWLTKIQNLFSIWRLLYTNSATSTSQLFIHFHSEQKTSELEKGFKLIKIFGTFTSWFWLFTLISRKDKNVIKVIKAFKKFINSNEKIYRLIDLKDFFYEIPSKEIDYVLIEI